MWGDATQIRVSNTVLMIKDGRVSVGLGEDATFSAACLDTHDDESVDDV